MRWRAVAVAVVASVLLTSCSGGDEPTRGGSGPASSKVTQGSTTTAPISSTTVVVDGPVIDATGAFVEPATEPDPVGSAAPDGCASPSAPGLEVICTRAGSLVTAIEQGPGGTGSLQVTIMRVAREQAASVARFTDPDRRTVSAVTVRSVELAGRSSPGLAVGFRSVGSGSNLELDLLDDAGTVSAHRSYEKGRAVVSASTIDGWAALFGPDDANCCPSMYRHEHLVFDGAVWHVAGVEDVPADAVPPGDFA